MRNEDRVALDKFRFMGFELMARSESGTVFLAHKAKRDSAGRKKQIHWNPARKTVVALGCRSEILETLECLTPTQYQCMSLYSAGCSDEEVARRYLVRKRTAQTWRRLLIKRGYLSEDLKVIRSDFYRLIES